MVTREMTRRAWAVAAARQVFDAALICYPRALRVRYGDEMRATFAAHCADAAPRGTSAVAMLLVRELSDLACASVSASRFQRPSALGPQPVASREPSTMSPSLFSDLRYAARMLLRQPGFT